MDPKRHLEVAMVAFTRGLLDARTVAEAMLDVGRHGGTPAPELVWMQPGRLSAKQLEAVLDQVESPSGDDGPSPVSARHLERYVRTGVLGVGAMGEVAACTDTRLGRRIALKTLLPEIATNDAARALLEREARITGNLEHPHIIPVYDAGRDPRRGPYYVMRVVDQPSLADVLAKLRDGDPETVAQYTLARLLRHFVQVCNAIGYAHSRGVIHCDLKPANILIGAFGEVLVVDWGLACRLGEDAEFRGGTPGFIPPERFGSHGPVDARTDVFALGAVLYQLLCLKPVFGHRSVSEVELASLTADVSFHVVPPRERRSGRTIPAELEEICLKALSVRPDARYETAGQMAEALESYFEGTKERERQRLRADALTAEGDELTQTYEDLIATRPQRLSELASMREGLAPWDDAEAKTGLWDAEDRLRVMDALAVRTLYAAVAAFEQALTEVSGDAAARRGLSRLYRAQLRRARERRDEFERIYFEELLQQHEDAGAGASAIGASLSITCRGGDAVIALSLLGERARRLVSIREQTLGAAPIRYTRHEPGDYVALIRPPGGHEVRIPLVLRDGDDVRIVVDLAAATDVDASEIFIAGGEALLGGDGDTVDGGELRRVDVAPFVIAERPVAFSEYLEFVAHAFETDPEHAAQYLPCAQDMSPYWRWDRGTFVPARVKEWGNDVGELLELPAVGVDALSADAYAAWRSQKPDRRYRLPNEDEWEKAARGVDGRRYPWGDAFDPSFCKMRESRPGRPRPEPSGIFTSDVSPFGVRDTAGGVAEWATRVEPSWGSEVPGSLRVVSRGGAWSDGSVDCRLSGRRPYLASEKSGRVGFRLVRTVTTHAANATLSHAVTALLRASRP